MISIFEHYRKISIMTKNYNKKFLLLSFSVSFGTSTIQPSAGTTNSWDQANHNPQTTSNPALFAPSGIPWMPSEENSSPEGTTSSPATQTPFELLISCQEMYYYVKNLLLQTSNQTLVNTLNQLLTSIDQLGTAIYNQYSAGQGIQMNNNLSTDPTFTGFVTQITSLEQSINQSIATN